MAKEGNSATKMWHCSLKSYASEVRTRIKERHLTPSKRDSDFWQRAEDYYATVAGCGAVLRSKRGRFCKHCFIAGLQWVGTPCQQRAIAEGQCSVAAKQRGGGKHIAQVKFTYQIHRLNQKREKPLVLCTSQSYAEITFLVGIRINF